MKYILEQSRFTVLIAVAALLIASLIALIWSISKVVILVQVLITPNSTGIQDIVAFVELIDACLIAATLLIFAVTLYELFIGDLKLPQWLVIHHFHELKEMLSGLVILIIAIKFLAKFVEGKDPAGTLNIALAAAVVILSLVAFLRFGGHGSNGGEVQEEKH